MSTNDQTHNHKPIGQLLLEKGLINQAQLNDALHLQKKWRVPLGQVLQAKGYLRSFDFAKELAEQLETPFVNLLDFPPDESLLNKKHIRLYSTELFMPWRMQDGMLLVATAEPSEEKTKVIKQEFGDNVKVILTSKFDVMWALKNAFRHHHLHTAVHHLSEQLPHQSARYVFTEKQIFWGYGLIMAFLLFLVIFPFNLIFILSLFLSAFYVGAFVFRTVLVFKGFTYNEIEDEYLHHGLKHLDEESLPVYTLLIPVFKETEVLHILVNAIRKLDYPLTKLDVKIILEDTDIETIEYAKKMHLESYFELVLVDEAIPKSKPKALNYALRFARGEFVTIYDAEDKPDPDQLKKAVLEFRRSSPETICLQARLNYFNSHENWLSRLFTLDYSLWFDFLLPGLDVLGIPIPLGGTSNHFKTKEIIALHGWDPHNMTEDADLGVRIAIHKKNVRTFNSTTYEEANIRVQSWIKQRSRWIKGYMQTWLVHMRTPLKLYRQIGKRAFWGFHFFVGGSVLIALINPILWIIFIAWLITDTPFVGQFFIGSIATLNLISFLLGNGAAIYLSMISFSQRKFRNLAFYTLMMPIYWVMISIAGYKALWELFFNPFHWHKTQHGVSKYHQHEEIQP